MLTLGTPVYGLLNNTVYKVTAETPLMIPATTLENCYAKLDIVATS